MVVEKKFFHLWFLLYIFYHILYGHAGHLSHVPLTELHLRLYLKLNETGLVVSEDKSFENVAGRWTTLPPCPWLRKAKSVAHDNKFNRVFVKCGRDHVQK